MPLSYSFFLLLPVPPHPLLSIVLFHLLTQSCFVVQADLGLTTQLTQLRWKSRQSSRLGFLSARITGVHLV